MPMPPDSKMFPEYSFFIDEKMDLEKLNDLPRVTQLRDFPGGSDGKASAYNVGDPVSIPGLGRSPGE